MKKRPLISLYTPGNRPDLIEKAERFKPDGIVIDFEDAVPLQMKAEVRENIAQLLPKLEITTMVRVNAPHEFLEDDLKAVVSPHIYAVALPMAEKVDQVRYADNIMTGLERERGLEPNSVKLVLLIETALGVARCLDVCSAATRVESIVFGSAEDGDLQADLHSSWSVDGPEINYSRCRALVEARAAGLPYVLDGAYSGINDLEGLKAECTLSRKIGYDGRTLIHPSHIAIAREAYEPKADQIEYYQRLVVAFEDAEKAGKAAITFENKMVDYAMYNKAKIFLGL
jgi:citrate lyase subunit beta/citryl-CoA lyase